MNILQEAFDYSKNLEIENQLLKNEIARLKEVPAKPEIKPSKKAKDDSASDGGGSGKKKGGSKPGQHRKNKKNIEIHETIVVWPSSIPEGAKLKDRQEFTVQDIEIKNRNTR